MATGLVCWVFGVVWSLLIIAIAWIFYRPVLGIIILAVAGGLVFWLVKRSKEKKKAAPAKPEEPSEAPKEEKNAEAAENEKK